MQTSYELREVIKDLYVWRSYEPAVKCDLTSCALRFGHEMVFIDPIPLSDDRLSELTSATGPVAIVLTNGNHARAADAYRKRFSVPVWSHADARMHLGIPVDRQLEDGEEIIWGMRVVAVPGAVPGEIGLHAGRGVFIVGDALINLGTTGFSFLPERYCSDSAAMQLGLRNLLRFEFEVMTFAHGWPLISGARQRLENLLA